MSLTPVALTWDLSWMNPEASHGKHLETVAVVQKCPRAAVSVDGDQKCPGVVGRAWAVKSKSLLFREALGAHPSVRWGWMERGIGCEAPGQSGQARLCCSDSPDPSVLPRRMVHTP